MTIHLDAAREWFDNADAELSFGTLYQPAETLVASLAALILAAEKRGMEAGAVIAAAHMPDGKRPTRAIHHDDATWSDMIDSIKDEARGERIAAELIASAIRAAKEGLK